MRELIVSTTALVTADDFARMSFDGPVELVQGEIVVMTRSGGVHGVVCLNVGFILESWSRQRDGYQVVSNDTGVITEKEPDTVRGPDVFVVRRDRLPGGIPRGNFPIPPEVCIEVNSPHDRWSDIIEKVGEYLTAGVSEVWVIDPELRQLHVYGADSEPQKLSETQSLRSDALPEFRAEVSEFFHGL